MIYSLLLVAPGFARLFPGVQSTSSLWTSLYLGEENFVPAFQILACNNQIKQEGEEILYKHNVFVVPHDDELGLFCRFSRSVSFSLRNLEISYSALDSVADVVDMKVPLQSYGPHITSVDKDLSEEDAELFRAWIQKSRFVASLPALRNLSVNLSECCWSDGGSAASAVIRPLYRMINRRERDNLMHCEVHLCGVSYKKLEDLVRALEKLRKQQTD